jgi:hypothetical protein
MKRRSGIFPLILDKLEYSGLTQMSSSSRGSRPVNLPVRIKAPSPSENRDKAWCCVRALVASPKAWGDSPDRRALRCISGNIPFHSFAFAYPNASVTSGPQPAPCLDLTKNARCSPRSAQRVSSHTWPPVHCDTILVHPLPACSEIHTRFQSFLPPSRFGAGERITGRRVDRKHAYWQGDIRICRSAIGIVQSMVARSASWHSAPRR